MREVTLTSCDGGTYNGSDIVICHEETNPEGREITVCVDVCDGETSPLVLTGSDQPTVGSTYTVTGGIPPYSFSFDGGTINSDGEVLSIVDCSVSGIPTGTVAVSDHCGKTESITVRLTGGEWVQFDGQTCNSSRCQDNGNFCEITTYDGAIKTVEAFTCCNEDYDNCAWQSTYTPTAECSPTCPVDHEYTKIFYYKVYEWECE